MWSTLQLDHIHVLGTYKNFTMDITMSSILFLYLVSMSTHLLKKPRSGADDASSLSVASTLTVLVHPLLLLNISDHYTHAALHNRGIYIINTLLNTQTMA